MSGRNEIWPVLGYARVMRLTYCIFLTLMFAYMTTAAEQPAYPRWDCVESVANYSKRSNIPPTESLDLGNGIKLDLVLIPAGDFIMGVPEPEPLDDKAFQDKILVAQALLAVSGIALLVILGIVIVRAIRQKRGPQFSLKYLLLVTIAASCCMVSGKHWRYSERALVSANTLYAAAKKRFESSYIREKPAHPVTITKPFFMGKFPVTQDQYRAVTGLDQSRFKGKKNNPVEQISWDDAQAFCKKLSERTKQIVRLPTEAEWEYSCRAGTVTAYHSGDNGADLERVSWNVQNSDDTTHPVGEKESNAFGLYDMHGNVSQWCQDWYAEDYYKRSEIKDPQGPAWSEKHSVRGGSWGSDFKGCRTTFRIGDVPGLRYHFNGFRIVMSTAINTP